MSGRCGSRWGENETRLFVKLYLQHECLWNVNHEDYKLKCTKNDAIQDVITKFAGITNILLDFGSYTKKIRSLRSTYSQERKLIKERSTPGKEYRPTLKWFNDYDRCLRLGLPFKDSDEINKQENDHSIDETAQQVWLTSESKDSTDDHKQKQMNDSFTPDDDYLLLLKTEPEDNEEFKTETEQPVQKRKIKKRRYSSSSDELISKYERKNKKDFKSHTKESAAKEDEFDIYGKYIASQLRELGLPRALNVQLKIQSIVSEARIEHLSEDG